MDKKEYTNMVNEILKHTTARELAVEVGATERSVARWKKGIIPQNLNVRDKIVKLYKLALKAEPSYPAGC